ncbi:hypothetical protein DC094_11045 [Pelagibaculum spongiae]|uniref:Uncharacterized protein n=1 Tax=Pelagibaculum spongiae TaxID=2080658 RepID=A0A2V1H1N2_9GAMM|nr:hypothetical protein DC094_11045 [Pelagibaculum spongiae]
MLKVFLKKLITRLLMMPQISSASCETDSPKTPDKSTKQDHSSVAPTPQQRVWAKPILRSEKVCQRPWPQSKK